MTTLLEKRQQKTITDLTKRKASAQAYIDTHTAKLAEKLAPYHNELEIVEKLLAEHAERNPELGLRQAS